MINTYFDKIYVINLKKDISKRNKISELFKKHNIDFTFFDATYGYDKPYLIDYNNYCKNMELLNKKKLIKNPGALGYLLTWKNILKTAINNKYEKILCFDDDVILDNDFNNKFNNFITKVESNNKNWKIINLGASQHVWKFIDLNKAQLNNWYRAVSYTDGSFAIGLHKSVFQQILNDIENPILPFDSGAICNIYKLYPNDNYVAYPNIVVADLYAGEINKKDNIEKFILLLKWNNFNK